MSNKLRPYRCSNFLRRTKQNDYEVVYQSGSHVTFLHTDVIREARLLVDEAKREEIELGVALKVMDVLLSKFTINRFIPHGVQRKEYRPYHVNRMAGKFSKEIGLRENIAITKRDIIDEFYKINKKGKRL